MEIVRHVGERDEHRERVALAAALVHDVGHGPFSHAFETVGSELELKVANHVRMSDSLIREGELAEIFRAMGSGFANDVADMVRNEGDKTVHNAVVSSQFDADRLDYMRRDRLMAGIQHSSIDYTWLLENLETADIPSGSDEEELDPVPTFVIGPKAIHAVEAYVLGLFQLYPTVYFHKATRGAEKLFVELMVRLVKLVQDDSQEKVGLHCSHPLVQFAKAPDDVDTALRLDDTVVWQGYRVWILSVSRVGARLAAERRSFSRKPSSQPAFFSFPRIDVTLPPSVSRARFSASFRIIARFSGPLSFRFRRPSSPMVTSRTQWSEFSIHPSYCSFSNRGSRFSESGRNTLKHNDNSGSFEFAANVPSRLYAVRTADKRAKSPFRPPIRPPDGRDRLQAGAVPAGSGPGGRDVRAVRGSGRPEPPSGTAGGALYGVRLKPGRHALPCS